MKKFEIILGHNRRDKKLCTVFFEMDPWKSIKNKKCPQCGKIKSLLTNNIEVKSITFNFEKLDLEKFGKEATKKLGRLLQVVKTSSCEEISCSKKSIELQEKIMNELKVEHIEDVELS